MIFEWSNQNNDVCNLYNSNIDQLEDKVVLGRYQYHEPIIGCCGLVRYDSIFPVEKSDFEEFKKEAIEVVKNYGKDNNPYSIEYFWGKPGQNFREDGESIYLLINENGKWSFYEKGVFKFSVNSIEELEKIWED